GVPSRAGAGGAAPAPAPGPRAGRAPPVALRPREDAHGHAVLDQRPYDLATHEAGAAGHERLHVLTVVSEWIVEAHVDRGPLPAERELHVADDTRRRQAAKAHAGSDLELLSQLVEGVEYLAEVDER